MSAAPIAKLVVKPHGDLSLKRPTHSAPSSRSLNTKVFSRGKQYMVGNRARKRVMVWQIFTIIRRLVVIAAAVQYIYISMAATARTVQSLGGAHNPQESFRIFTATLICGYAGNGLIRDSPLVQNVLKNDTTPRDYALFLESKTKTSSTNCSAVPKFNPAIYNYDFLSRGYHDIVNDAQYNITALAELELVLVVVDCTFTQLKAGDRAMVRVFTLVRSRNDHSDLYLIAVSMNVQDYEVPNHSKQGPGLLTMLNVVQDMRNGTVGQYYLFAPTYPYQRSMEFEVYELVGVTVNSYLELRSIPQDPQTQPVKHLITARKRGLFDGEDQSNIRYMFSLLNGANATSALSAWEWLGEAVILDSWAWVHGIHFFFGVQTIFSLVVLSLVAYHNFCVGKIWIGDPFASVSNRNLVMRAIMLMKAVRSRFTNVYVYEVEGNTVKDTARLAYPHTFMCVPLFNADIYNYGFLGRGYEEMVNDTQYNITDLAELELVVVVDCTFTQLQAGDPSMVRVFNLVRSRTDPSDLYLVSVSMNVQDYEIPAHSKRGPGLLAMLIVVHDMNEGSVDQYYLMAPTYPYQRSLEFEVYEFVGVSESSYLELRSIPRDPLTQPNGSGLVKR
ncbi:hypothetical protein BBJ29_003446 [Phytophthora kernoviae]|uniref:Uncharacterized protein n=1 Tax=Phytophthora kernoviae TaxID=325452 RepID=A0A3F2RND0_9STRA|nr:hypothetical protein BBP00_00006319 [Phytophthora kernoviae]RLN64893.1 hypothetical protein BBJ29_003446 [Phytophthora kernoviae]